MTHAQGAYLYTSRLGVNVHATRCGATTSMQGAYTAKKANMVTCKRCIKVLLPRG